MRRGDALSSPNPCPERGTGNSSSKLSAPDAPWHWAWRAAAVLWLLVVLGVGAHQVVFWRHANLATDVLALLPADEQAPEVSLATRQLVGGLSRQVVVMLGTPNWARTQQAQSAFQAQLESVNAPMVASGRVDASALQLAIDFYRPWRNRLLTSGQHQQLEQTTAEEATQNALAALHQPAANTKLSTWAADPLGLWQQWWLARAGDTSARPRDGTLWLSSGGQEWAVMPYTVTGAAFALGSQAIYAQALEAAELAARQVAPELSVLRAGVPLHSEAAAVQASWEINTIGWGSLAAVLLLAWLAFRSLRVILLVGISLLVGCAVALSVTAWVFTQVHLITLVFGASLIGVAEDYGLHYFASRQGQPGIAPRSLMRQLLPGLLLALLTSVMAYAVLGIAAFPGLRQMAVFSSVGLVAAFCTAVCWFPLWDGTTLRPNRFSHWVGSSLQRWPRWHGHRLSTALLFTAMLALFGWGAVQVHTNDDIRQLQSSPSGLIQSQREVGRLLGVASPTQFYLVRASTMDELLAREEALTNRLNTSVDRGLLAGYRALSDWVPSSSRQERNAQRTALTEGQVLAGVNTVLGESLTRPEFSPTPLTLPQWLAHPASNAARDLWLGTIQGEWTSVVMLRGISGPQVLPALANAAQGLEGIRWVDHTLEVSNLLGRYRWAMTALLLASHIVVLALLAWRYRSKAWRAWLPSMLASLATVAILACAGQPFQLFNVLALALLLGIGVDYSIFLLEHPAQPSAWLAVVLGAASTWLSLGLLGLSNTPALRAFGLTLLVGVPLVWVLAPVCCARR
jgi:predicted exporter